MIKINNSRIKLILAEFEEEINNWGKNNEDKDLERVYIQDKKDLTNVLLLAQKGDFKQAKYKINKLDTIVRDVVPEDAWYLINLLG